MDFKERHQDVYDGYTPGFGTPTKINFKSWCANQIDTSWKHSWHWSKNSLAWVDDAIKDATGELDHARKRVLALESVLLKLKDAKQYDIGVYGDEYDTEKNYTKSE